MKTAFFTALSTIALTSLPVHAQTTTPATEAFAPGAYTSTDGEDLYQSLCSGCHMPDGEGAEGAGEYPALTDNPNLEFSSYAAYVVINGQAAMPKMGHLLNDEQMVALLTYLQTNLGNDFEPDATLEMVATTRPVSPEEELAEQEIQAMREMDATGVSTTSGVVRHPVSGSDFPILTAVEVPGDATLVYLSGTVPQVVDDSAEQGSPERYGDTAAQTFSALASIEEKLDAIDLGMSDIIKMQVYLVAPDGSETMDFSGFMEGYVQYFGTDAQPNLPTRSVFEVAGLANPSWMVEIEVVAVRSE